MTRSRFDDLYWGRSIDIAHGAFELEAGGWMPHRTELQISSPEATHRIVIDISRARYEKAYPMPFEVPDDIDIRQGL